MQKLTAWSVVAALAFASGIAAAYLWGSRQPAPMNADQAESGRPCPAGLVSVAPQPQSPLRITVSAATCNRTQMPWVRFEVENVSAKPIDQYRIQGLATYEGRGEDRSMNATSGWRIEPQGSRVETINGGFSSKLPPGYVLAVCGVRFADGTVWQDVSACGNAE